jgi:protein TonB
VTDALIHILKRLLRQAMIVSLAAALVFLFFMLLPILQVITQPPEKDLMIRTVDVAEIAPPPPPPMEQEEPEPEPEPEPPPPAVEAQPLDLSMLEMALAPGDGGFGGGDFSVNLEGVTGNSEEVDAIFSLSDLDQKPRVVYQPAPIYPQELARKGMQGTVYVLFIVDKTGRTRDLKVQKSTHPAFNEPAVKAVKQWKFEPGKRKGKPVQFRMRVPITFQK